MYSKHLFGFPDMFEGIDTFLISEFLREKKFLKADTWYSPFIIICLTACRSTVLMLKASLLVFFSATKNAWHWLHFSSTFSNSIYSAEPVAKFLILSNSHVSCLHNFRSHVVWKLCARKEICYFCQWSVCHCAVKNCCIAHFSIRVCLTVFC